jgi:hypothetical protein
LGIGGGDIVADYYVVNRHEGHTRSDIIELKKDLESRVDDSAWARRILTGSAFGRPWKQSSTASFQNCILMTRAC